MDLFQEDWKELQVGLPQKVEGHPLLGLLGVPNRYGKVHYRYVFDLGCDYAVYWASTVGDPNYLAQFEGLLASDTKPLIQKMFGHIPTTYVGRSYWDFPNQLHWLCRSNFRWERVGPNKELRGPLLGLWDVFKQCYQFVFDLDCDYLVEVCSAIIVDPLNYLADFEGKLASETEPLIQQMFDPQTQSVYHTDYLAWFLGIVGNHPALRWRAVCRTSRPYTAKELNMMETDRTEDLRRQLSEAQQKNLELASMLGLDSKQIIQEASSLTEMVDYMPASIEGQNMAELENVKAELTSLQEEREELLRQLRQIGYEWVRSAEGKLKLARLNTSLEPNLLAQVEQGIPELSKRDAIWMRMYFIRHVRIADIANLSGVTRAAVSYRILKGVLSIKKFLGSKPSP